jgi:hypothetical protein
VAKAVPGGQGNVFQVPEGVLGFSVVFWGYLKVFFFFYYSPGGPLWTHLDVYVTNLGNKGQNLVHTQKHLITLHFLQKI